jgi:type II secretory pathway pseudopilin PulG
VARRMWRVLRAVLYMLRRGVPSGRKLAMDLHLLLRRGKFAGKALGDLLTSHHRGAGSHYGAAGKFSCLALHPGLAVHEPSPRARREVEFSCSNTPSAAGLGKRDDGGYLRYYDAADVARVFEMLNDDGVFDDESNQPAAATPTAYATPSPARLLWAFSRSPAVRRVAASPSGGGSEDAQVDRQADEFIRRFYEQLRAQRSAASTPDYYHGRVSSGSRRTPRAIA